MPLRKIFPMTKIMNSIKYFSLMKFWITSSVMLNCPDRNGIFFINTLYANIDMALNSVIYITRDVNFGWFLRTHHENGAWLFFICLYIHFGRGLYYSSYQLELTWTVGVLILFCMMVMTFLE